MWFTLSNLHALFDVFFNAIVTVSVLWIVEINLNLKSHTGLWNNNYFSTDQWKIPPDVVYSSHEEIFFFFFFFLWVKHVVGLFSHLLCTGIRCSWYPHELRYRERETVWLCFVHFLSVKSWMHERDFWHTCTYKSGEDFAEMG